MCSAEAVEIHALALFFAGCSLFAICHFGDMLVSLGTGAFVRLKFLGP